HREEKKLPLRSENRQRARNRPINWVNSPAVCHASLLSDGFAGHSPHGKSQAMKLTAAMAMPTPKRTPASTRFEPPSPKAKVRPATTMATSERPRAMVLVKACCITLTAFSQGEAPVWPKAGAARNRATTAVVRNRKRNIDERKLLQRDMFTGMPPPQIRKANHLRQRGEALGVSRARGRAWRDSAVCCSRH